MEAFTFLSSLRRSQALMRLLGHRQTYLFEYFTVQDSMVIYNKDMTVWRKIEHYLGGVAVEAERKAAFRIIKMV